MSELAGYIRWMEFPDEIEVDSLIRFADGYVRVLLIEGISDKLCKIHFESGDEYKYRFTGEILLHEDVSIETFTKSP